MHLRLLLCLACAAVVSGSLPTGAFGQDVSQLDVNELEARVGALFEKTCARSGCHAGPVPQQGMDLSQGQFYESTVGVASQEKPELQRVHPGQPDSSYLVMKIEGAPGIVGVQMPLVGELAQEEIDLIKTWIRKLPEKQASEGEPTSSAREVYPFTGWKVVNLPTNRTVDRGSFLFLIGHRFNPRVSDGYDAFFGIDGSGIIFMNLGYAITDRLFVNLGRSNADDDVELDVKYRFARQGRWPLAVGVQTAVNWISEKPPGESRFRGEAFKFSTQLMLTRGFADRAGIAVVPGVLFNPAVEEDDEGPLVTIGLGGRWRFYQNLALVVEWVPIVAGYTRTTTFGNDNRFDSWAGGLEIATGGHVFQIIAGNSVGIATDQYLRGGDLDLTEGDLRLGFNIFRVLNF